MKFIEENRCCHFLLGWQAGPQPDVITHKEGERQVYPPLKLSQLLGHMEIAEILRAVGAEIEKKGSFSYLPKAVKNTAVEGVYHG